MGVIKTECLIDEETGQMLKRKESKYYYWDDSKGYLYMARQNTVKSFDRPLPGSMTVTEVGRAYIASKMMFGSSNMLAVKRDRKIRAATVEEISEHIDANERVGRDFLRKMYSLGVMKRVCVDGEHQIYINPLYFFNGKWLSLNLYLIFKDELDKALPSWVTDRFNNIPIGDA